MKTQRIVEIFTPNFDFKRLTKEEEILVDNIIKNLTIRRGSYIFDPEVGTDLYTYLFDMSDSLTYEIVYDEIKRIVENSGAELVDIQMSISQDKKSLIINITIKVVNDIKEITLQAQDGYISLLDYG